LGSYETNFAKFVAINCTDMKDKQGLEVTGKEQGRLDMSSLEMASKLVWLINKAKKRRAEAEAQAAKKAEGQEMNLKDVTEPPRRICMNHRKNEREER
jgi:hypothetical protein